MPLFRGRLARKTVSGSSATGQSERISSLQKAVAERDLEIALLRTEVKRLQSIIANADAMQHKVSQALAAEVEKFTPISSMGIVRVAIEPLAELETQLAQAVSRTDADAVIVKLRSAASTALSAIDHAVAECVAESGTVARCYGVVDAYTRDMLPIYASVFGLIKNSEVAKLQEYNTAVQAIEGHLRSAQTPRQVTGDPVDLYSHAACLKPTFDTMMQSVETAVRIKDPSVTLSLCAKLKSMSRILEKCTLRRELKDRDANTIFDVVRAMFVSDSMAGIVATVMTLLATSCVQIVRIKDRFASPAPGGWRDLLLNFFILDDPNKHIVEIQLCHRTMLKARSGLPGHDMYSRTRNASEILERLGMGDAATKKNGLCWTVAHDTQRALAPSAPRRLSAPINVQLRRQVSSGKRGRRSTKFVPAPFQHTHRHVHPIQVAID